MTASLPDNVTAVSAYVVHCTAGAPRSDITVNTAERGSVRLKQDGDVVLIDPADVPGLIAALSAAAGLPLPEAPESDPAYVTDDAGDRWVRQEDGLYRCYLRTSPVRSGLTPRSLDDVRAEYGIQREG